MRRRRAWWGRRKFRARSYQYNPYVQAFEDDVILRKVRGMETRVDGLWDFTATALRNTYPDLFNERHLPRALKRMARQGKLKKMRNWGLQPVYELDDRPAKAEAA